MMSSHTEICPFCKTEILAGAIICTGCGARKMTLADYRVRKSPAGAFFLLCGWCCTVGFAILVAVLHSLMPVYQVVFDKEFFVTRTSWTCTVEFFAWDQGTRKNMIRQVHFVENAVPGEWRFSAKRFRSFLGKLPEFGGGLPDCPADKMKQAAAEKLQKQIAYSWNERGIRREGRVAENIEITENTPRKQSDSDLYVEDKTGLIDYAIVIAWFILVWVLMGPIIYVMQWVWFRVMGDPSEMIWVR